MAFYVESLRVCRALRPRARWGWYGHAVFDLASAARVAAE